jgi:DNA-binding NarL/FixJ family response regulator
MPVKNIFIPLSRTERATHTSRSDLSSRGLEVLSLVVDGLSNKEIAHTLSIAGHTLKNHIKNILAKLDVDDRTQAAAAAIQRGIVHLPE